MRWTISEIVIAIALIGCGDDRNAGSHVEQPMTDGGEASDGSAAPKDGGGAPSPPDSRPDGGSDPEALEKAAEFWDAVQICGTPVEDYMTASLMAERADAAVLGAIVEATSGNVIMDVNTPEDFYAEANLTVRVDEVLRHSSAKTLKVSVILPRVARREALAPAIEVMREALPVGPVLLLLRERADMPGLYILVNTKGLWTRTAQLELDNPMAAEDCDGDLDGTARDRFLGGAQSVEELAELLRR